ncbi:MAG: GNAT family N-acetyltransferase [Thermoanaerobaculia bacterium]|nr:GNAT family N-acetyltransferase [Thermoanaerobaculia bacterium]
MSSGRAEPGGVRIRPVTAADHDAVWEIFHEVVAAGDSYAFDPATPRDEALRLWVETPRATYVAELDGRVAGTYYLKDNQPGLGAHVANAGYMTAGWARGRGVGAAMGDHSLTEARRLGYRAMQFNLVVATNVAAVRLWHRLGFDTVGVLPEAFRHLRHGRVDALVMYRRL